MNQLERIETLRRMFEDSVEHPLSEREREIAVMGMCAAMHCEKAIAHTGLLLNTIWRLASLASPENQAEARGVATSANQQAEAWITGVAEEF